MIIMALIDIAMVEWKEYFEFYDKELIELCMSTVATSEMRSDPVWMFLVGASGGLKTTILRTFDRLYPESVMKMDMATSAVFASSKSKKKDLDLLSKLDGKCLLIKDFTALLQKNRWERDAIFGELRAIYDGDFHKHSGNIGEKAYENYRFTILAAVTTAIEEYYSVSQLLGERFLKLKIDVNGQTAMRKALENVGAENGCMDSLRETTAHIVRTTRKELAKCDNFKSDGFKEILYRGADLIAKGRTAIRRDEGGNMKYIPESEKPTRIIKQLRQLLAGCAIIEKRSEVEIAERIIKRVAYDSIPSIRAYLLGIISSQDEPKTIREIRDITKMTDYGVRYGLEDLAYLELITKIEKKNMPFQFEKNEQLWEGDCKE